MLTLLRNRLFTTTTFYRHYSQTSPAVVHDANYYWDKAKPFVPVTASAVLISLGGAFGWLKSDIQKIDNKFEKLDNKVESVRTELKGDIGKLDNKIDHVRTELKDDIEKLDNKIETVRKDVSNLREEMHELRADLRVGFSEMKTLFFQQKSTELKQSIDNAASHQP